MNDMNDMNCMSCCTPPPGTKPGDPAKPRPYTNKYESLRVNDPSKPYIFHRHSENCGCFPHWQDVYKRQISKCVAAGAVNGYEDNTIRPKNTISRAEMATLLSKLG